MEQVSFQGFGPADKAVANWRTPVRMTPDIVALCADESQAVRWSLDYAKRRHGYKRAHIASLMNVSAARLSEWSKPEHRMPEKWRKWFCHATGCALLEQHLEDVDARRRATGQMTQRERDAVVVALMTRVA